MLIDKLKPSHNGLRKLLLIGVCSIFCLWLLVGGIKKVPAGTQVATTNLIPNLGFAAAVNSNGIQKKTTAIFYGGTSVNKDDLSQNRVLKLKDSVSIKGLIKVDKQHVGQPADIFIMAEYKSSIRDRWFIMLDNNFSVKIWDGKLKNLVSFKKINRLAETQEVNIYNGLFKEKGKLQIYFGYRTKDVLVFNASQAINVLIK